MTRAALNSVCGSVPGASTSTAARTSQRVRISSATAARDRVSSGVVLDPHGHDVEPVGVGGQHDLELVADAGDRAHGVLDLARETS